MTAHSLLAISDAYHCGEYLGTTSICSAHPVVIEAALDLARESGKTVLIEATCNQVNQEGGYTGMTPGDFRRFVAGLSARVGFDPAKIVFGGDHLGPNPWKRLPADTAMEKAGAMIRAYAEAGFTKLHLDTSMGCQGEPEALGDQETARRAAHLAAVAEDYKAGDDPVYVIGTEVPVPGGATNELDRLEVTKPGAVFQTYEEHKSAFEALGLQAAFSRVMALVVQPGVEFGHSSVVRFDARRANALSDTLGSLPGIVFEAHSTDYQSVQGLRDLVESGFAILKVGPGLTFALREALYALDAIADIIDGQPPGGTLMRAMDDAMLANPEYWQDYYRGTDAELWLQRHFSYSDRIRYYWPSPTAQQEVSRLQKRLDGRHIPEPVLSQYLPGLDVGKSFDEILTTSVQNVLRRYDKACHRM